MIALQVSYLLKLLAEMYKASTSPPALPGSGHEVPFDTADELVAGWRHAVRRFNVMAPAPSPHSNLTWGEYMTGWSNNIAAGIEPVLDRYAEALGIDTVSTIEDVINGGDYRIWFREAANTITSDRESDRQRQVHLPFGSPDKPTTAALDDFSRKLSVFFGLFGDASGRYAIPTILWTHMPLDWASARYDGEMSQSLVVMRTSVLPRSPSPEDMADADMEPLDWAT